MPQPCGAFAMRSRALPVHSMIKTKYNCTPDLFFRPSSFRCSSPQHFIPQSSYPPTSLPSHLSGLPSARVTTVQHKVVHPAGALGPVVRSCFDLRSTRARHFDAHSAVAASTDFNCFNKKNHPKKQRRNCSAATTHAYAVLWNTRLEEVIMSVRCKVLKVCRTLSLS